ncbi:hypothetical protein GWK47_043975 [Chionoecetes opilio]|uniref:Uncharacterized protein n=1 Tax=Chionoecetes opilio TaxID=41210 RepID=A0A8J4YFL9_CHIOP|nr:hypothetical protein GWK47_043975 [Chionoecetes opilio]
MAVWFRPLSVVLSSDHFAPRIPLHSKRTCGRFYLPLPLLGHPFPKFTFFLTHSLLFTPLKLPLQRQCPLLSSPYHSPDIVLPKTRVFLHWGPTCGVSGNERSKRQHGSQPRGKFPFSPPPQFRPIKSFFKPTLFRPPNFFSTGPVEHGSRFAPWDIKPPKKRLTSPFFRFLPLCTTAGPTKLGFLLPQILGAPLPLSHFSQPKSPFGTTRSTAPHPPTSH